MALPKCKYMAEIKENDIFSMWHNVSSEYPLISKMRFPISFSDKDVNYYLKMLKGETDEENKLSPVLKSIPEKGCVVVIRSLSFDKGDEDYSKDLLNKFIFALTKVSPKPRMIIFINEGVKLPTSENSILESLRILEKQGVKIYLSSSCIEYYKCDNIKIGNIIDIFDISSHLFDASKVIIL